MTRTIETTLYQYGELPTDAAKAKAREWFSKFVYQDSSDWEFVYDDAILIAKMLGIEISNRRGTRAHLAIYFSGFSSRGDGASFEGSYSFEPKAVSEVKTHAPTDSKLHAIAQSLTDAQARVNGWLTAQITTSGNYCHSHSVDFDFNYPDSDEEFETGEHDAAKDAAESEVTDALRAFADWIYAQLKADYEFKMSDASIIESIEANEYEFLETGERA